MDCARGRHALALVLSAGSPRDSARLPAGVAWLCRHRRTGHRGAIFDGCFSIGDCRILISPPPPGRSSRIRCKPLIGVLSRFDPAKLATTKRIRASRACGRYGSATNAERGPAAPGSNPRSRAGLLPEPFEGSSEGREELIKLVG